MTTGEAVKELIRANGSIQRWVAENVLGIAPTTLSDKLAGRIRFKREELQALADHYRVPVETLETPA